MRLRFIPSRSFFIRLFQIVTVVTMAYMVFYLWLRIKPAGTYPSSVAFSQLGNLMKTTAITDKEEDVAKEVKCVHPPLDPFDPTIMQHYAKEPPVNCRSAMKEWVYVINGTFHVSQDAERQYGKITCEYSPVERQGDYAVRYSAQVKPMLDGMPLQSDFFHVLCTSASGRTYRHVHAAVARNHTIMKRLADYRSSLKSTDRLDKQNSSFKPRLFSKENPHPDTSLLNLGVLMLGFDSVSSMSWHRNLPKAHKHFIENLGAIELENYNIMGDGTACALLPMLTGKKKEELPEARPGVIGGKPVDNYPWIWKEFSRHGYATAFAQDGTRDTGAFHFNMRGFEHQPTDHYMRPFYLAAEQARLIHPPLCWGSTPRHVNFMNWFGSLMDMYKDFPKFLFGHYLELSHDHTNRIQAADDDLVEFLKELERKGHLNSTLMILMADHGPRFAHFRQASQGVLEGRLPYFAFRFPSWVHEHHPEIIKNMRINTKRLTTPLDIHETFQSILNYSNTKDGDVRNRAISLFKEIPRERTCTHAGITPHWCACLVWHPVNHSDPLVRQAVAEAISAINSYTKSFRTLCAELSLLEITKSVRYIPNSDDRATELRWLKFEKSNAPPPPETHRYQVSFRTSPGQGHYEVTCDYDVKSKTFSVGESQISRINKYGSDPACIERGSPHLRPYCYCVK